MKNVLFDLDDRHRLAFDHQQWIVQRRVLSGAETRWKALGYIGGRKTLLERVAHENGVRVGSEAQNLLDALPDTFLEWRRMYDSGDWPLSVWMEAAE